METATLQRMIRDARVSPDLRRAMRAIERAIGQHDTELAAELSVVKSFISSTGTVPPAGSHFSEDAEYNDRVLGESVYGFLDEIHHRLATAVHQMPSGTVIYTTEGKEERGPSRRSHPIIKLIEAERAEIYREAERRNP